MNIDLTSPEVELAIREYSKNSYYKHRPVLSIQKLSDLIKYYQINLSITKDVLVVTVQSSDEEMRLSVTYPDNCHQLFIKADAGYFKNHESPNLMTAELAHEYGHVMTLNHVPVWVREGMLGLIAFNRKANRNPHWTTAFISPIINFSFNTYRKSLEIMADCYASTICPAHILNLMYDNHLDGETKSSFHPSPATTKRINKIFLWLYNFKLN